MVDALEGLEAVLDASPELVGHSEDAVHGRLSDCLAHALAPFGTRRTVGVRR